MVTAAAKQYMATETSDQEDIQKHQVVAQNLKVPNVQAQVDVESQRLEFRDIQITKKISSNHVPDMLKKVKQISLTDVDKAYGQE